MTNCELCEAVQLLKNARTPFELGKAIGKIEKEAGKISIVTAGKIQAKQDEVLALLDAKDQGAD